MEGYPSQWEDGSWNQTGAIGLHGRVSHIPATNVYVDGEWQGDDYVFWCQGKVVEAQVFKAHLVLSRKISAKLGENSFCLHDRVENLGHKPQEHMFLYHCNLGFPLCQEGARYVINSRETLPRDEVAQAGLDTWDQFPAPIHQYEEQCFYHDVATDADNMATVAFINRNAAGGRGLGTYITYDKTTMPYFTQWKNPSQGEYTTGLEPANCRVEGRAKYRDDGALIFLDPGEVVEYTTKFGVLTSQEEIDEIEAKIRALQ